MDEDTPDYELRRLGERRAMPARRAGTAGSTIVFARRREHPRRDVDGCFASAEAAWELLPQLLAQASGVSSWLLMKLSRFWARASSEAPLDS